MKTGMKCLIASALSLALLNLALGGAMLLRIDPTVRVASPFGEPPSYHGELHLSLSGIVAWVLLVGTWATSLVVWLSRWTKAAWRGSKAIVVALLTVTELLNLLVLHPNLLLMVLTPSYGAKLSDFVERNIELLAEIYLWSGLTRHLGAVFLIQLGTALVILSVAWSRLGSEPVTPT